MPFLAVSIVLTVRADAATPLSPKQIAAATDAATPRALALFKRYLAIPNDSQKPDHIKKLTEWIEEEFRARGFQLRRFATEANPLVFAERRQPGAKRTVLVYLQADGQPVDPAAWDQPDPYRAVLKRRDSGRWRAIPWTKLGGRIDPDWRTFARSASDSKGPNVQFLVALDILEAEGVRPDYNLKVVVDTEEELGSPHLASAVKRHRKRLAADLLYIFDGPPHASGRPTLSFGARGITTATLDVYGPKVPQHSGHYGNYVPNPAFHLARILGTMKTQDGRVAITGFYDGIRIPTPARGYLDDVPDDEPAIRAKIGFSRPDAVGDSLQLALQYPSLNIRGLRAGWVGKQARTIIPATATAELDIRLVKENDPKRLLRLIRQHIERLGYTVLDRAPTDADRRRHPYLVRMTAETSYVAYRSPFDSVAGKTAAAALTHLNRRPPIRIRTMGGSVPISPFVDTLGVPAVAIATVNPDNNQHSPNENLRVGDFLKGIQTIVAVLATPLID